MIYSSCCSKVYLRYWGHPVGVLSI